MDERESKTGLDEFSVTDGSPAVSIIMPVYNAAAFLGETLRAVLAQTFADFELILVDDGSADNSAALAASVTDPRIRLIRHAQNRGVAAATNTGFAAARGRYLVMMDHDDLSMPDRLATQIAFLEAHPDLDGCGGGHVLLSRAPWLDRLKAAWKGWRGRVIDADEVAGNSVWGGMLFNPTMCLRRTVLERVDHGWDPRFSVGADDEFYGRLLAAGARLCILPQVVLRYRRHAANLSRRSREGARQTRVAVALAGLARLLPDATDREKELHTLVVLRDRRLTPKLVPEIQTYFTRLIEANQKTGLFPPEGFKRAMARHWSRVCALAGGWSLRAAITAYYGFAPLRPFAGSPFFLFYQWQKRRLRRRA